jgi:Protein of unknown function with HXXEE motif
LLNNTILVSAINTDANSFGSTLCEKSYRGRIREKEDYILKASKNKRFSGLEPKTFFSFLVPGIFLANGIGHLFQLILFQSYVPGIITSIVIIYPYSFITLKYLIHEQLLTVRKFLLFLCLGFILQAPIALLAHIIVKGMVYYVPLLFNELVDKGGF